MNQLIITDTSVRKMSSAKLLDKRAELMRIALEAQTILTGVNAELLMRAENEGVASKLSVGRSTVSIITRPIFKDVTLETAMKLKATKLTLDTAKLAALLKAGKRVKGATTTRYITVR